MSENTIYQSISIVLDPEIIKKLDEGNFNKSKLIDSLLNEYFNKEEENKTNRKPSIPPPPDRILKDGKQPIPPKYRP